ncbi:MAG: GNAT family N-acetyltransferase [Peptococcaceae bacterium]|jgi:putative acetyltransferase|nr:GNAT family N-acetyltransferase [Peptococcaceae bacterium]MDH7525955.1 GNAT family N-acetyltransferase [Peptococcaceae bacterium]
MEEFIIRNMKADDYDKVIEIWKESEGIGLSEADSRGSILFYLEHNPGMSFVAEDENGIAGAVLCGHDGRRGYLHHLAVKKEARGKGLGKRLAEKCLDRLKEAGIKKCHIFVLADNEEGLKFWNELGWQKRKDIILLSKNI